MNIITHKTYAAHFLEQKLNSVLVDPKWPDKLKLAGVKPGKKKRVYISGATVIDASPTDPTDGGPLINENEPIFLNIDPSDINQGQRSDCYFLSVLSSLSMTDLGKKYLQYICYADPTKPNAAIIQFTRNGIVTRVHVDLLISTAEAQLGPDKDIWVELFEKAYAFYRSGADTYASLDWGSCSVVMSDLGLLTLTYPPNAAGVIANLQGLLAKNECLTMMTPATVGFNLVGSHAYAVATCDGTTATMRNPWGSSGGILMNPLTEPQSIQALVSYQAAVIPVTATVQIPVTPAAPVATATVVPMALQNEKADIRVDGAGVELTTCQLEACSLGGQSVGYVEAGARVQILLQITTAGLYALQGDFASAEADVKTVNLSINGKQVGTFTVPNTTAWQTWKTFGLMSAGTTPALLSLVPGIYEIVVAPGSVEWNLARLRLIKQQTTGETDMSKDQLQPIKDAISAQVDQAYALGLADGAVTPAPTPDPTPAPSDKIFTQADMDAAVAQAKADLKNAVATAVLAEDQDLQAKLAAL